MLPPRALLFYFRFDMFVFNLEPRSFPLRHQQQGYLNSPCCSVHFTHSNTMDKLTFKSANRERIQAVQSSFGPAGRPLNKPDRVLVGEGHLMKQGQRRTELKAFFLFNDILAYGSMILNGRWHKKLKIIPLGEFKERVCS